MNLYSIDIKIIATAYIKAESEEEAMSKAIKELTDTELELREDPHAEMPITGMQFDSPELPEISLSPTMTIHGPWEGQTLDLIEEDVPESEEED